MPVSDRDQALEAKPSFSSKVKSNMHFFNQEALHLRGPTAWKSADMTAIEEPGSAVRKAPTPQIGAGLGSCKDLDDVEWHLNISKVTEAWEYSRSVGKPDQGDGILIACPDTGYSSHSFTSTKTGFEAEMYQSKGYNPLANWRNGEDENDAIDPFRKLNPGHGTSVSAIMAGQGTEADKYGFKVRGAAPKAKVLPLRVANTVYKFQLADLRKAIYYAKDNGAHIFSTSLGTPSVGLLTYRWKDAVKDAIRNNMIFVSAAGQMGQGVVNTNQILPASYKNVIAVGAVDANKMFWESGMTGDDVAFSSYGVDICAARASEGSGESARGDGTSYATALTAGTAALWLSHHGRNELISIAEGRGEKLQHLFCKAVEASVEKPAGWNEVDHGAGILDAKALLIQDLSSLPLGDTRHCKIDV